MPKPISDLLVYGGMMLVFGLLALALPRNTSWMPNIAPYLGRIEHFKLWRARHRHRSFDRLRCRINIHNPPVEYAFLKFKLVRIGGPCMYCDDGEMVGICTIAEVGKRRQGPPIVRALPRVPHDELEQFLRERGFTLRSREDWKKEDLEEEP